MLVAWLVGVVVAGAVRGFDLAASVLQPPHIRAGSAYSPTHANFSIFLGANLSLADFDATKTIFRNVLADMMAVDAANVRFTHIETPSLERTSRGSVVLTLAVDYLVPYACSSVDGSVVAASLNLRANLSMPEASAACNLLPTCSGLCVAVGPAAVDFSEQSKRMRQGLELGYATQTGEWLTLSEIASSYHLYPDGTHALQLESGSSVALLPSAYLAIDVALRDADGADAIAVVFAIVASLRSNALPMLASNVRSLPLSPIPLEVYGLASVSLLRLTMTDASVLRRSSIGAVVQTGAWRALLPANISVVAADVNLDASQPFVQMPAPVYSHPLLILRTGCAIALTDLEGNASSFFDSVARALPSSLGLQTGLSDTRPLFADISMDVDASVLSIVLPLVANTGAPSLDDAFVMRLSLAFWNTPFYCNLFPSATLELPSPPFQTSYATLALTLEMHAPLNPFVFYRLKHAIWSLLSPLDLGYADITVGSASSTAALTRMYTLYIYYYTIDQQQALPPLFASAAWPDAFTASVGAWAVLQSTQLQVPTSSVIDTTTYPGSFYTPPAPNARISPFTITRVGFVRPLQTRLFRSLTSPSNAPTSTSVLVAVTSGFAYNAFYLDAVSMGAINVTLNDFTPLGGQVAPIILANRTTQWAFLNADASASAMAFCVHLKQVYDVLLLSMSDDALTVCVDTSTASTQVSMQNNRPDVLDATYAITNAYTVTLTLRDVSARQPYAPSAACLGCQNAFLQCRSEPTCRQLSACLSATSMPTPLERFTWSPAFLTALQAAGVGNSADLLPAFAFCHNTTDATPTTMAAWAKYVAGMQCLGVNACPLNWLGAPDTSSVFSAVTFSVASTVVRDTVALSTTLTRLVVSVGSTNYAFPNVSASTNFSVLASVVQATVYAGVPLNVRPTVDMTWLASRQELQIQYTAMPPLALPTLVEPLNAVRSVLSTGSLRVNVVPYDAYAWTPSLSSSLMYDPLWTVTQCATDFNLTSSFLSGSDYLGHLAIETEAQIERLVATFLPATAVTCLASIPGVVMNASVELVLNDVHCAAFVAYPWTSLLNMSNASALQVAYTADVCPLYTTHGKACIETVVAPTIARLFEAAGGCCDPFEAVLQSNYSVDNATQLVRKGTSLFFSALCAPAPACASSTPCTSALLAQLAPPLVSTAWFEPILWSLQVSSSQVSALWAGETVVTTSGRSFSLYNATNCALDGCGDAWNALWSWLATFPVWSTYPMTQDNLSNLFAPNASLCVEGPHLLQLANDILDMWHPWPLSWSWLRSWTSALYSNLDYIFSTWMDNQCYHIPFRSPAPTATSSTPLPSVNSSTNATASGSGSGSFDTITAPPVTASSSGSGTAPPASTTELPRATQEASSTSGSSSSVADAPPPTTTEPVAANPPAGAGSSSAVTETPTPTPAPAPTEPVAANPPAGAGSSSAVTETPTPTPAPAPTEPVAANPPAGAGSSSAVTETPTPTDGN
ncbi:hypothetical protein SDRG_07075 [Saprolegnia diclina VS20]|uniref:Secreted protein n=1 Tax=Saprolegnia diclina (strain VS20) TaxID=1156394 RepID=T0RS40_SAPDV|nr:hypothetical protein SDRG_07075 [Saprolegnia diclina VS20]EQC35363.1 hypothetical protein SDRG_07075 [Saprolegnia diclina VS20]|eukprot:XP_008611113.1 hypothetical protein SDRG_07075 [Saprolegnia diclina VS20]